MKNKAKKANTVIKFPRFTEFEQLTQKTQKQMKKYVRRKLSETYEDVISDDGYVFAKGTHPVMLIAHMDTVHKEVPQTFKYKENGDNISSPQGLGGDDRCGIYMIMEIIKEIHCSVLFLEDEEIGCVGAEKFCKAYKGKRIEVPEVNYLIEFDRRGSNDAVYYDLDNIDFEHFITESSGDHFKTAQGSCSDISYVAPTLQVAAVNLSCGYYHEHHEDTYVKISEMKLNIEKAKQIILTEVEKPFEWAELPYDDWYGYGYYGYGYGNYNKYYVDKRIDGNYHNVMKSEHYYEFEYDVYFVDSDGAVACNVTNANSEMEAIGITVMDIPTISGNDIMYAYPSGTYYEDVERYYFNGKEGTYGSY